MEHATHLFEKADDVCVFIYYTHISYFPFIFIYICAYYYYCYYHPNYYYYYYHYYCMGETPTDRCILIGLPLNALIHLLLPFPLF